MRSLEDSVALHPSSGPCGCKPYMRAFPSGVTWAHSKWCKKFKGQKVGPDAPWIPSVQPCRLHGTPDELECEACIEEGERQHQERGLS